MTGWHSTDFTLRSEVAAESWDSPPFVCSNIGGSGKPRVEDENTSEGLASSNPAQQGRIVTKSEAFSEPMDSVFLFRVFSHVALHFDIFLFLNNVELGLSVRWQVRYWQPFAWRRDYEISHFWLPSTTGQLTVHLASLCSPPIGGSSHAVSLFLTLRTACPGAV